QLHDVNAEEDEDVSMADCSSSAPNADAVSFVSCTETFASSAYETVASEAETVMPDQLPPPVPAPMDHALRLSLRLSADATSFANFRLSSLIPRDMPLLDTLGEATEDAVSADNSAVESADGAASQRGPNALPESKASQSLTLQQDMEQEQEDNPVHMRLRSLRSRRLNKDPASAADTSSKPPEPSGRRFRATQTAAAKGETLASAAAAAKKKPVGKMGQIQLDRLTKLNTRRNATYMTCRIERYNVTREGKRPPSPSLLMQQRAEERRGSDDHRSIYSDSDEEDEGDDEDVISSEESEEEEWLSRGEERCLEELVDDTRPLSPLLLDESDDEDAMLLEDAGVASAADTVAADPGTQDIKRKSIELSGPLHPSTSANNASGVTNTAAPASSSAGTRSKKQCRRPTVQWGTRSILRTPYLVGHAPKDLPPGSTLRSILTNPGDSELPPAPEPVARSMANTRRAGPVHTALKIVRVSTIKYEESSDSESEDADEDASQGADDEYIPKKSIRNSRKK
ncbi:hypothetical protein LPJ73_002817, partial [Coemansia sp. RSA 2703]